MDNYTELMRAAVARRLLNISRSLEATLRASRDVIEPGELERLWRRSSALLEVSRRLDPPVPPVVPDDLEGLE